MAPVATHLAASFARAPTDQNWTSLVLRAKVSTDYHLIKPFPRILRKEKSKLSTPIATLTSSSQTTCSSQLKLRNISF